MASKVSSRENKNCYSPLKKYITNSNFNSKFHEEVKHFKPYPLKRKDNEIIDHFLLLSSYKPAAFFFLTALNVAIKIFYSL